MGEEVSMSEVSATAQRVTAVLIQRLGISPGLISPTAKLADDLGVDSVDAVEFALALERAFKIHLPDEVIGDVQTVQDVVELVDRQLSGLTEAGTS
jgi:acyl carrier protein